MNDADHAPAGAFLRMLGAAHTFQTFDDAKQAKRAELARIVHGDLDRHGDLLRRLNERGAGVFVMVNSGDGKGRKVANVRHVRALFLDLDGSPLEPVAQATLRPHCIVESSPGRFHAYWLVSDCALSDFTDAQRALAQRFSGDPKVCDLPRVMRVPGFMHRKGPAFRSRIMELHDTPAYTMAQLREGLALDTFEARPVKPLRADGEAKKPLPDVIPEGERNTRLFALARGLVQKGHDRAIVNDRLQALNAKRCRPPLCASEVDDIAAQACSYGSDGFAKVPHRLLDSEEWKASPRSVHEIVLLAFRRYNGSNNGNIALTFDDFKGRDGFGKRESFYKLRRLAVDSGFLTLASEGRRTQKGRTPDLYGIAPRWLSDRPLSAQKGTLRMGTKGNPYIDKQLLGDRALDGELAA